MVPITPCPFLSFLFHLAFTSHSVISCWHILHVCHYVKLQERPSKRALPRISLKDHDQFHLGHSILLDTLLELWKRPIAMNSHESFRGIIS